MDIKEIKEIVLEYVVDEYLEDDDDEIGTDTPIISGGIVDSFSMVSLKRFVEHKYQISIPDDRASAEDFDTVDSISEIVLEFVNKK
jgi:acyl carrier protein